MIVTHPARSFAQLAVLVSALSGFSPAAQAQGEVNIYSYREPQLIDPLLKAFTDKTGIKANLAHKPAGGDREQARDIFSGKCDLALGNTYYMALMMKNEKNPEQQQWAGAIKILFPNAADRGSHVNISGMAMAKHAPNKANALKLMEFLASEEAQKIYANANNEYPVNSSVPASDIVRSWGTLKADALPLENIAKYRKKASELVDKANFDAGPSS